MLLNKNDIGTYYIETQAFKDIVSIVCLKEKNISPAKTDKDFVACKINKNDELVVTISIKIKQGIDVNKTCLNLQNNINENILLMTGVDCKNINIDIQGFTNK